MEAAHETLTELGRDDRDALLALGVPRRHRAGEVIVHAGDESGAVYVVLAGRVKITVLAEGGKEAVLGFRGPGALLGEMAAIDGSPRAATVTAIEDVRLSVVPGGAFRRLLDERPSFAHGVLRSVLARLREADRDRLEVAAYDVTGRVARRLVALADEHGTALPDGSVAIGLPLSQEELAAWTASSREAVGRALHLLRRLGWIRTDRRRITVRDLDALRRLAP